jgi:hypothetical protein
LSSLGTMDRKGDQSDDDVLEASNGWIGSKGPPLSSENPPTFNLPHQPLPGESSSNGLVRQISRNCSGGASQAVITPKRLTSTLGVKCILTSTLVEIAPQVASSMECGKR